jgi:uncharacterized protein
MTRYAALASTPSVEKEQRRRGSPGWRTIDHDEPPMPLTDAERGFVSGRDSFYLATVSESGWPYVQHRGGPPGFLHVVDEHTLAWADVRGNRQYVSIGNIAGSGQRVAMILVDYPRRARMKLYGRARALDVGDPEAARLLPSLRLPQGRVVVEQVVVVDVEAFAWNCQQHITPRWTEAEVAVAVEPLQRRLTLLEAENEELRRLVAQAADQCE